MAEDNVPHKRKMIRFDDVDCDEGSDGEEREVTPPQVEDSKIMPHAGVLREFTTRQGVTYQRCGGGRRRMPHRGDY